MLKSTAQPRICRRRHLRPQRRPRRVDRRAEAPPLRDRARNMQPGPGAARSGNLLTGISDTLFTAAYSRVSPRSTPGGMDRQHLHEDEDDDDDEVSHIDPALEAKLGPPFFQSSDPRKVEALNAYRVNYQHFRKGSAHGAHGEIEQFASNAPPKPAPKRKRQCVGRRRASPRRAVPRCAHRSRCNPGAAPRRRTRHCTAPWSAVARTPSMCSSRG